MELMSAASLSPVGSFDVSVVSERVWIPYRLYADEPAVEAQRTLAPLQQAVLSCLYSRHHDGYVRQRHIERIAPRAEDWIAPFVVHLIGEYVLEIVLRIKDELADIRLPGTAMHTVYGRFAAANANFITLTSQRAASYWNCYHRHRYPRSPSTPRRSSSHRSATQLDARHARPMTSEMSLSDRARTCSTEVRTVLDVAVAALPPKDARNLRMQVAALDEL
ncbi:hypothetical protein [Micromonospora sp. NPDC047740]|uniref:hypothetical protein n=1 Tax=Micromonospora sp. NPDC047740 TaxID=3364254 RepID=UPI00371B92DE